LYARHFTCSALAMDPAIRKIIHVDMDAFFASVEQRDNRALRGRPVAVGGDGDRSVVAAASYEARKFGIRSAMPSVAAKRLCPDIVFVRPRFDVYRQVSSEVREIFLSHTPLVEFMSLDEAYLDVTVNRKGMLLARDVATDIRATIKAETGLTASAGISGCKFLAKMASDMRKPDGLFVIPPERGKAFISKLPIRKFHGIGPATADKMIGLGIMTGADLERVGKEFLIDNFGKVGTYFHDLSLGIDNREVKPERVRKSVSVENTLRRDIIDHEEARAEALAIAKEVWDRCDRHGSRGRTVSMKIKFEDFVEVSRSKTLPTAFPDVHSFTAAALSLLDSLFPLDKGIRLVGFTMSSFAEDDKGEERPQLDLFA
jgi:DNA polymerase-4